MKNTNLFDFAGLDVLVTGGTGFLGSHLVARLGMSGAIVHVVSRSGSRVAHESMHWYQADLTNSSMAESLLAEIRPDFIFHLCSHGVGAPEMSNVLPTFRNDLMTMVNILAAVTELKIPRLILAASMEEPKPSAGRAVPSTPYMAAKWAGSLYAKMFHSLYKTPVVQVRPYMTYGPGQPDHKIIPYSILSFLRGDPPELGKGSRPVDWIYIDDVIKGMLAAAQASGVEGETIDLGTGSLMTIRFIVEKIRSILGSRIEPLYGAAPERLEETIRAADTRPAHTLLRWQPTTSLEDGLSRTVAWYKSRASGQTL